MPHTSSMTLHPYLKLLHGLRAGRPYPGVAGSRTGATGRAQHGRARVQPSQRRVRRTHGPVAQGPPRARSTSILLAGLVSVASYTLIQNKTLFVKPVRAAFCKWITGRRTLLSLVKSDACGDFVDLPKQASRHDELAKVVANQVASHGKRDSGMANNKATKRRPAAITGFSKEAAQ